MLQKNLCKYYKSVILYTFYDLNNLYMKIKGLEKKQKKKKLKKFTHAL